jgi:hypothetical protein
MSRYTGRVIMSKTTKNDAIISHHGAATKDVPKIVVGKPIPSTTITEITIAINVHMMAINCLAFSVISNILTSSMKSILTLDPQI